MASSNLPIHHIHGIINSNSSYEEYPQYMAVYNSKQMWILARESWNYISHQRRSLEIKLYNTCNLTDSIPSARQSENRTFDWYDVDITTDERDDEHCI